MQLSFFDEKSVSQSDVNEFVGQDKSMPSDFEKRNNDKKTDEVEFVGFSTGDEELDLLINGKSTQDVEPINKQAVINERLDNANDVLSTSVEKVDADSKKTAGEFEADDDDYSYYGRIKPIAENSGKIEKTSENEKSAISKSENGAENFVKAEVVSDKNVEKINDFYLIEQSLSSIKNAVFTIIEEIELLVRNVYNDIFKNNPSFRHSLESVLINLEEYLQALLLSSMLESGVKYEKFPGFVYEILPRGDIFKGVNDELAAKIKIASVLKMQPLGALMLAAVDVAMGKNETKKLIDGIYNIYAICISAINRKTLAKDEILFNLITFAKNQGVNI